MGAFLRLFRAVQNEMHIEPMPFSDVTLTLTLTVTVTLLKMHWFTFRSV